MNILISVLRPEKKFQRLVLQELQTTRHHKREKERGREENAELEKEKRLKEIRWCAGQDVILTQKYRISVLVCRINFSVIFAKFP